MHINFDWLSQIVPVIWEVAILWLIAGLVYYASAWVNQDVFKSKAAFWLLGALNPVFLLALLLSVVRARRPRRRTVDSLQLFWVDRRERRGEFLDRFKRELPRRAEELLEDIILKVVNPLIGYPIAALVIAAQAVWEMRFVLLSLTGLTIIVVLAPHQSYVTLDKPRINTAGLYLTEFQGFFIFAGVLAALVSLRTQSQDSVFANRGRLIVRNIGSFKFPRNLGRRKSAVDETLDEIVADLRAADGDSRMFDFEKYESHVKFVTGSEDLQRHPHLVKLLRSLDDPAYSFEAALAQLQTALGRAVFTGFYPLILYVLGPTTSTWWGIWSSLLVGIIGAAAVLTAVTGI